ncbi:MAG: amino acid ABC transporter permease [Lachnospiraceae bacterium]|nr:amino acid ABC transporter permease [Agathobacter sp.]MDD6290525.1 amino acid ABC transporter permease [Lachnospiraceae bacterium]
MDTLIQKFTQNFIENQRYMYLVRGLGYTLIITAFALIIGVIVGFLVAIIRSTHDKHGGLNFLNALCKIYLTVWRGTPTVVQLMIMYYIVLATVNNKILVAVIAFGLNSAAYVAEIVRSGIMSVDEGQFEAGRSLGLNYSQTMRLIILPQAFKNVLPALGNEMITLLKETSVGGYIGTMDLTKGADIIRSQTYEPLMPLLGCAAIYLILVMILTAGLHKLEGRLRSSER